MQMVAMPCRFLAASLRPTPVEAPSAGSAGLTRAWLPHAQMLLDQLDPLAFARYLVAFFVGIAATIAWQSCTGPAGQAAASAAAPDNHQMLNAILLDTTRRHLDRLAANIATIEEHVTRGVDRLSAGQEQLAASQEQMAHDISTLQAALSRNAEPAPRPASVPAANPVQRPSQPPAEADARSADWRRQPCCQWPAFGAR
jgi:hypothetical protein